jgi:hypothetical protein
VVYKDAITLSYNQLTHKRTAYNTLDLLGDIGGITEILAIFFSMILWAFGYVSFVNFELKKLYVARIKKNES